MYPTEQARLLNKAFEKQLLFKFTDNALKAMLRKPTEVTKDLIYSLKRDISTAIKDFHGQTGQVPLCCEITRLRKSEFKNAILVDIMVSGFRQDNRFYRKPYVCNWFNVDFRDDFKEIRADEDAKMVIKKPGETWEEFNATSDIFLSISYPIT